MLIGHWLLVVHAHGPVTLLIRIIRENGRRFGSATKGRMVVMYDYTCSNIRL